MRGILILLSSKKTMDKLIKYTLKRSFFAIFVLIGLSFLIFAVIFIMPGDPARVALGGRAPEWVIEELREEMHLNDPAYMQYYYWAKNVLKGDFGRSLSTKRPVFLDIKEALPASLELVFYAAFFAVIVGIILGTLSGWNANSWIDNLVRIIAYAGICTPNFVVAIFFILIFGLILRIFPVMGRFSENLSYSKVITGFVTFDALITGNFKLYLDSLKHILLPSIALSFAMAAQIARLTRTTVHDNLQKDFISSVRSYGIPEHVIMFKYLLKPSLIPSVSVFGPAIAAIISGAFLIETIFNWPGLSRYGMNAIMQKDINAISAVVVVYGTLFVIANFFVDVIVGYLDPRISSNVSS